MSVAAAIIGGALERTAVATLKMTTKGWRPAHLDRGHDVSLRRRERRTMLVAIGFTIAAEDVRHFERGAIHVPPRREERWRGGLALERTRVGSASAQGRSGDRFAGR